MPGEASATAIAPEQTRPLHDDGRLLRRQSRPRPGGHLA
jgi:hypothetical protein